MTPLTPRLRSTDTREPPPPPRRFSPNWLCLFAAAWVVLTANGSFWRLVFRDQLAGPASWLFLASLASALVGLHLLLFRLLTPGRTVRVMLSFLLVIAAVAGWFMDKYGVAIDVAMLRNVAQTDPAEARDFLGWSLLWRVLWQAGLPTAVLWRLRLKRESWWGSLRHYALGALVGLALVLAPGLPMYSYYASFFRNQESARYLVTPANVVVGSINLVRKTLHGHQPFVPAGLDARRSASGSTKPLVVLMVVGETARAENFSLGGYERQTNPLLEKRRVFYFRDVTSCGTATAVSVPCMFSDLPRKEFDLSKADHRDTVLDVLQRSGLAVSWIDNQSGCKGVCARVPSRSAEVDHPSSCSGGECLDDALLYSLSAELPRVAGDSVIVMHTMGSHGPAYYRRVPDDHLRSLRRARPSVSKRARASRSSTPTTTRSPTPTMCSPGSSIAWRRSATRSIRCCCTYRITANRSVRVVSTCTASPT